MTERFTRNTESIRCWCYTCGEMTEHAVSDGNIGRCANDHTKKRDPRRARIAPLVFTADGEVCEIGNAGTAGKQHAVSIKDRLTIAALEGPNYPHDRSGELPPKKERKS